MSDKTRPAREKEQEDLLEQIFTQGLEKIDAPGPETAPSPPKQESSGKNNPPADRKSRRSAVYLYLLVLFMAAFLMLLLAYFIQQRSSEDTISDLRNSMSLSREELLAEIRELEAQNAELDIQNVGLIGEVDRLTGELDQWRERYEEQVQDANNFYQQYYAALEELHSWDAFWTLEQYYQLENYEACAAVLLLQQQSQYGYRTPSGAERRYEEIVKAVIMAGILDEDYLLHQEDYQDLLYAFSTP